MFFTGNITYKEGLAQTHFTVFELTPFFLISEISTVLIIINGL